MGCGVAAHIDNSLGGCTQNHVDHRLIDTRTRRIENHHVGTTVGIDKLVAQHLLHIARIEDRISDSVDFGIDLCVLDSLGNILNTNYFGTARRTEIGNRTRTRIEVIEHLSLLQIGSLACHFVELVGLLRVGLIERFGTHLESQALHLLEDVPVAAIGDGFEVARRVIQLLVDHIDHRGNLGELLAEVVEQCADTLLVAVGEDDDDHHLVRRGGANDHIAHKSAMFAHVVELVAVLQAETLGSQSDSIRRLGLQPTLFDVQHLVEHCRNVETESGRRV